MSETPNTSCKTTCPYCGVGCGVVMPKGKGSPSVTGDKTHPANHGRLCVKGSSLHETLGEADRLLHPRVRGQQAAWPEAIDAVATAIQSAVAEHGPESVGFYLSGQLLTEDYYTANKLAKGFIGTPHVDTNSRLCMSSAVAAHKRAFGADVVPACYEDLELADLVVLVGSNTAWNHPILYQRIKAAGREGRRVVVIDPRETATSELADLHLRLKPGSDTYLFNGLLAHLYQSDSLDSDYIEHHCDGFSEALASALNSAPDIETVAGQCDVLVEDLARFFDWFAENERTVTVFSQGVNQSATGTDKANAIINCHLATGRVGKPGASPFSMTGQPNAMGGREVGGLANTLAAHMDYQSADDVDRVARFWQSPGLAKGPGHKAIDLFDAVHRGEIKVLWIMATNPAVSLPDNARVREALEKCPTVIVSDCIAKTDTTHFADILLPATGWGEKDGTVTNSERRISRQRQFLPNLADAMPDWWIISAVGRALGHEAAFSFENPASVFREHARLSAFENDGTRPFSLSALTTLTDDEYEGLTPCQWPVTEENPNGRERLFGDGRFATADKRGHFVPIHPESPAQQPDSEHPLVVNSGRIRDQWHTMTRTGRTARLWQHRAEPFIDVHPDDAMQAGLTEGQLGRLKGRLGDFVGRVSVTDAQRAGEVFIPIHWNQQFSSTGLASSLMAPDVDPISGQPESKHGVARLERFPAHWEARLLCRETHPRMWQAAQWSKVPLEGCESWWIAGEESHDWSTTAARWLGGTPQIVMSDPSTGRFRAARFHQERVLAVLLVESPEGLLPDLVWLASCFSKESLTSAERRAILAGKDAELPDIGPIICSCFQVGQKQIEAAVQTGTDSVADLGDALKCGTNCGSCIPELKKLIETTTIDADSAAGKTEEGAALATDQ